MRGALAAALLGCRGACPNGSEFGPDDPVYACVEHDDCVSVMVCECSNSGDLAVAVNVEHAGAARRDWNACCPARTPFDACTRTLMAWSPPPAACDAGRCVLVAEDDALVPAAGGEVGPRW